MPTAQARRLCPNAAYLTPRFTLYRRVSDQVMELLHALSPLVEPLSLDEAFVDLEAGGTEADTAAARAVGERLRRDIRRTTGLTGSVGLAGAKMLAKIASEQAKPDGLVVIEPGTERELLGPMTVRTLPGVGPATAETLRRAGIHTIAETAEAGRRSWCASWARRTAPGCTPWRWAATSGPWWPSGMRSPYRSRTPSTWT